MIYRIELSNKNEFLISQKEFDYLKQNMSNNFVELTNGVINPSFIVSILIDEVASRKDNIKRLNNFNTRNVSNEDLSLLKGNHEQTDIKEIKKISELISKYSNAVMIK